ncbi:uncharacterized protein MELLADRAFT_123299 [Melampsora larici-populina 98AG31]|uniref:Secreted protein n=1 Tax=Melampsora larici-populina (strain 98AG31 / pathotype 3-4-7) TaxID=747676 RepID=F4RE59_MELLP|nr:uncharacterized protein MELLADRAFT_123299 [Melampsora larici-populina 98AG31]EGG09034.1 secreted protein [Melampsora larici-populina 98AG31]
MNLLLTLYLLCSMTISYVISVECYNGGQTWGNSAQKEILMDNLDNLCRQLTGNYPVNTAASRCMQGEEKPGNQHDFVFRNLANFPRVLTMDVCLKLIKADIQACPMGGYVNGKDWFHTSDPNEGECD